MLHSKPVEAEELPPLFPLTPPIQPMLAKIADALPEGDAFLYEPK